MSDVLSATSPPKGQATRGGAPKCRAHGCRCLSFVARSLTTAPTSHSVVATGSALGVLISAEADVYRVGVGHDYVGPVLTVAALSFGAWRGCQY